MKRLAGCGHRLPEVLVDRTGVVAESPCHQRDLTSRLPQGLADVSRLELGELVASTIDAGADLPQDRRALIERGPAPLSLGAPREGDPVIEIGGVVAGELCKALLRSRLDHVEPLSGRRSGGCSHPADGTPPHSATNASNRAASPPSSGCH